MAILVTGGAGFIGSHVCDALLAKDEKVICLDNFNDYYSPETKRKNIAHNLGNKDFSLAEADITEIDALKEVFRNNKIGAIVHLAARAGVRPSMQDPGLYAKVNISGTINLLELSRKHDIKKFVFGSSSSVYGSNRKVPFSESDPIENQVSPYAVSKRSGEAFCRFYSTAYGISIACLRFFTVYGPRGRPDMAPYKFTKLIHDDKPIEMYGDGSSQRDYTYVDDIVSGIISALEKRYGFEIINLGNSDPISLQDFIKIVEKTLGKKAKIIQKPMPKGDVQLTYADIAKAKKLLGYAPKTSIEEGMNKFAEWFSSGR